MAGQRQDIETEFLQWAHPLTIISEHIRERNFRDVGWLSTPFRGEVVYPAEKRRTKEVVDALRSVKRDLDDFWAKVDQVVHTKCGELAGTDIADVLSEPHTLRRTPGWVDSSVPKKKSGKKTAQVNGATEPAYKPLSAF
jgi:hypothetical protein